MKVCLGGTFNILHKGHKLLIDEAIKTAGKEGYLFIGISKGEMNKTKKDVKPFEERKRGINSYILGKKVISEIEIGVIKDKYGPSIEEDFDHRITTITSDSYLDGWYEFSITSKILPLDQIWIAIGIKVAWETLLKFYIDNVSVRIR